MDKSCDHTYTHAQLGDMVIHGVINEAISYIAYLL